MAIEIVYEVDCHCGGTATSTTLALGQPEEDGRVHIDVDLSIGQTEFECDDYGDGLLCPSCHNAHVAACVACRLDEFSYAEPLEANV